jgi:class 3 adenylate cyclase
MEAATPLISNIRFYQYCEGAQVAFYQSGMNFPTEILPSHPNYQFPIKHSSGECQFYLAFQSHDSLTVPLFYWEKTALQKFDIIRHLLFGLFFGLMISLALYNFLLFLSIQNRAYLWYVFYILTFAIFYLCAYGYFRFLFGSIIDNGISYWVMLSSVFTCLFALLFGNQFLQIKQISPKLSKFIYLFVLFGVLLFIPIKFLNIKQGIIIANIYPGLAISTIVVAIYLSLRSGYKPATYFAVAWGTLLISVSFYIAENLGLFPGNAYTHYGQIFGASLEAVLLSLALGFRVNDLRIKEAEAREKILAKEREAFELERVYAKSMQRFVPEQFLKNLDKENILQVKKGDAKSLEMAVLFTDIRGFTSLSETVGTSETFAFLNRYLEIMEPIIESNGGFIDKFIGDAIMALFVEPEKALEAAIAMMEATKEQILPNGTRLKTGIGIHFGELILGTVGSENRLETTVIGDTVNLASRIESLTKQYSAEILVSADVIKHLANAKYKWKELDSVTVRGKSKPVSLFQFIG